MESYLDYVDADPYDYYTRKLEAGPVHWDEGMRAWLVFGYDESRFVDRRDDLISVLWEKGPEIISPWSEAEVLAQCRVLFFAGSDTTAHFLRNAFYVLTTQPHLQKELRGDERFLRCCLARLATKRILYSHCAEFLAGLQILSDV